MKKQNVVIQLVLFFIFILQLSYLQAQDVGFAWAKSMGGDGYDYGESIVVDNFDNVYITGRFYGTVDFDPGMRIFNLTSKGRNDIFIQKLDANGNFIWAKSMGGSADDVCNSIALDSFGNVYTTGRFYGTVHFDPGAGILSLTSKGWYDIFIQKLCPVDTIFDTVSVCNEYTWANTGLSFIKSVDTTFIFTNQFGCDSFVYLNLTVGSLNLNAGLDDTICLLENITLTATGAQGYTWSHGGDNHSTVSPNATTTYYVTGVDTIGINDTTICSQTDTITVRVNPLPNVDAGSNQVKCSGDSVTLRGTGATTYVWDKGVTDNVSFPVTTTQTYRLTGTDVNGCKNIDTVVVTANQLPNVDAGSNQVKCSGDTLILRGTGATTYVWDKGVTDNIPFPVTTTQMYRLTGTDVNGCENTDIIIVTVNPLPNVDAGSNQTICPGYSVTLRGTGANTYVWDKGVTDNIAFPVTTTQTYRLTGTDINGCKNTDRVTVTVAALPNVDAGSNQVKCPGDTVILRVTGATTYVWYKGVTDNVSFHITTTQTYRLTGTDVNGCKNTDTIIVTVNPLPNVDAGSNQVKCPGDTVILRGTGATTYVWDKGVTDNVSFAVTTTQTYRLTGTDVNGCKNTDIIIVTVNPLPNVDAGSNQVKCSGDTVILRGTGANTYVWDKGVTDNVAFPVTTTQTYRLTGTDVNGCKNTDTVLVNVNPLPNVDAGSNQIKCSGDTVILRGTGANTYVWDKGVTDNVAFPVTTTQTYRLTGTDVNGCKNTDTVLVNVNQLPNVDAGSNQVKCPGDTVILRGTGANTYVWDKGVTDNVAFPVTTTQTYRLTGTDVNGCKNTDTVLVNVNPLPNVDAGSNQIKCSGDTVILRGTGANTYVWDKGVTDNVPFTVTTTQTYRLTGTDVNGCKNTDTVYIKVKVTSFINFDSLYTFCEGDSILFKIQSDTQTVIWNNTYISDTYLVKETEKVFVEIFNNSNSCSFSDTLTFIKIDTIKQLNWFQDTVICIDSEIELILDKNVDIKTIWSDGYIGSSRKIDESVDLCVTQSNICQTKEQCINIFEIDCECTYYIPNIFTPNGDNLNEEFKPITSCDIKYEFEIFDRWGNTIFITNNKLDKGWNGKIDNKKVNDVYHWKFTKFDNIGSSKGVIIEYGVVCIL